MNIDQLTDFFMWCTIINIVLMAFSFFMCAAFRKFIHTVHGKFFPLQPEVFDAILYSFFGVYKIFIIVFNVVPYIVLLIMN